MCKVTCSTLRVAAYVNSRLNRHAVQVCRNLVLVQGSLTAAKRMHHNLLGHVLKLSMAFHDSTPTGRLLNRFARDTEGGGSLLAVPLPWHLPVQRRHAP